jgi:hypothetical protein
MECPVPPSPVYVICTAFAILDTDPRTKLEQGSLVASAELGKLDCWKTRPLLEVGVQISEYSDSFQYSSICTGTRHFIVLDTDFSSFKKNCQLLPKYCLFQQNSRTKVVDLQKIQFMVLLQKFRAHTWLPMNFQTWWWKKTSHETITDSGLWASLHKNGSFLLQNNDILKESLFFLLLFKSNMNEMWWPGPEIFMPWWTSPAVMPH